MESNLDAVLDTLKDITDSPAYVPKFFVPPVIAVDMWSVNIKFIYLL